MHQQSQKLMCEGYMISVLFKSFNKVIYQVVL